MTTAATTKEKLAKIIKEIRDLEPYGPADYDYFHLDKFANRLEKLKDEL